MTKPLFSFSFLLSPWSYALTFRPAVSCSFSFQCLFIFYFFSLRNPRIFSMAPEIKQKASGKRKKCQISLVSLSQQKIPGRAKKREGLVSSLCLAFPFNPIQIMKKVMWALKGRPPDKSWAVVNFSMTLCTHD